MAMRWWFKAEKVEYPSKEPPAGEPIAWLISYVLEKDDVYYYRLRGYGSEIYIYDDVMSTNYLIARQYARNKRTKTSTLHAEYRLTLTEDARKIVDELLSKPFECKVRRSKHIKDELYYECRTVHPVSIPDPNTGEIYQGKWNVSVSIEKGIGEVQFPTSIPFNCGPLYPLWKKAVECWARKIAVEIKQKHPAGLIGAIRRSLLERKYIHTYIILAYHIY